VETRVIGGTPAETLRAAADAAAADLVAVGTRGPGWFERLLVGSVASEVLRGAHTHVLLCPAPGADERLRVERALVGAGDA
jgi:nucleotide-binding universal stress UspA family protein